MQRVPAFRVSPFASVSTIVPLFVALLLAVAVVAVPTTAHAYPDPQCTCTISSQQVRSGQTIRFTGAAEQPLHWKVTFRSETRTATGTRFETTFRAPDVDRRTVFPLAVEAAFVTQPSARATTVSGVCKRTFDITVLPAGAAAAPSGDQQAQGVLPDTGGPDLAPLGLAVLLVLVGAGLLRRARRHRPDA